VVIHLAVKAYLWLSVVICGYSFGGKSLSVVICGYCFFACCTRVIFLEVITQNVKSSLKVPKTVNTNNNQC
jgi:hypothetical protein